MSEHVLRPVRGAPDVTPAICLTATSGAQSQGYDVGAPGGQAGSPVVVEYTIFVGANPVTLAFVNTTGDEQFPIPLNANATYSLQLTGIKALRFRSAVVGTLAAPSAVVVASPLTYDGYTFNPQSLSARESQGVDTPSG